MLLTLRREAKLQLCKLGLGHLVPLHMTQELVLKETGFYLIVLQPCRNPVNRDPTLPLLPKRL